MQALCCTCRSAFHTSEENASAPGAQCPACASGYFPGVLVCCKNDRQAEGRLQRDLIYEIRSACACSAGKIHLWLVGTAGGPWAADRFDVMTRRKTT